MRFATVTVKQTTDRLEGELAHEGYQSYLRLLLPRPGVHVAAKLVSVQERSKR
jgi:hypothetical protein